MTPAGAVYLDTSAAAKLVIRERESGALSDFMLGRRTVYSSWLLSTELVRMVRRISDDAALTVEAHALLSRTTLVEVDRRIVQASRLVDPPALRTLAAIHLATALELGEEIEAMVVYDRQLAAGARRQGIVVVAPGADV